MIWTLVNPKCKHIPFIVSPKHLDTPKNLSVLVQEAGLYGLRGVMVDRKVFQIYLRSYFCLKNIWCHGDSLIDSCWNVRRTNLSKSVLLTLTDSTFKECPNLSSCKCCYISEVWGARSPCSTACSDPLRYQVCREATAVNTGSPEGYMPMVWSVIPPFRSGRVLCPCAHRQSRETETRLSWLSSTEHRKHTGK